MARRDQRSDLWRRLLALAGLVAIVGAVVGVLLLAGLLGNPGGIEKVTLLDPVRAAGQADVKVGPQVGRLAPDFEISDFDGRRHRLSDFRGKPVYVNFWATWCVPCTIELPDVDVLEGRHPDDLVVITVNRRESLDKARDYFHGIPRPDGGEGVSFAVSGLDPDDTLYQEYRALGMPASFFIDASGVITSLHNGIISLEVMEKSVAEALSSASAGG